MHIQVEIEEKPWDEVRHVCPEEDPKRIVERALRALVETQRPKPDVRDLLGKVQIDPVYDYKKLRIGE